jgi:hypothetical protein
MSKKWPYGYSNAFHETWHNCSSSLCTVALLGFSLKSEANLALELTGLFIITDSQYAGCSVGARNDATGKLTWSLSRFTPTTSSTEYRFMLVQYYLCQVSMCCVTKQITLTTFKPLNRNGYYKYHLLQHSKTAHKVYLCSVRFSQ